ncbi:TIGR01906 family membrane protein [Chloroflexota bacterium]
MLSTILKWLVVISLPPLLLAGSVAMAVNSPSFYEYGFAKYHINEHTGISADDLNDTSQQLISYFNGSSEEFPDITVTLNSQPFTLFNEREAGHMRDVRVLFRLDYLVLLISGVVVAAGAAILAGGKEWRPKLASAMRWGGLVTLGLLGLLGAGMMLDFESLFWQFHLLSFSNDLWLLNPATDYLIMLFPQGFWFDAALLVAVLAGVGSGVFWGVGHFMGRRYPAG